MITDIHAATTPIWRSDWSTSWGQPQVAGIGDLNPDGREPTTALAFARPMAAARYWQLT
jgi:hypothetical protein